jgi:hypothetical protein
MQLKRPSQYFLECCYRSTTVEREKLKQLPNGSWVKPSEVLGVHVLEEVESSLGGFHPPRLRVDTVGGGILIIECPSLEVAHERANKIAEEMNADG